MATHAGASLRVVEPRQRTQEPVEVVSLSDAERRERMERLIERLFAPDGFDRQALAHVEQPDEQDA
jgi:hypothetical protein